MELLDIYNEQRERTGRTVVRNGEVFEGERLLVVHVCVLNSRNEMLIQQRQMSKDRYPGCWDISAGGFVLSGEDSADAVRRELPRLKEPMNPQPWPLLLPGLPPPSCASNLPL